MATCCIEGCELEAYADFDECILHCDKSDNHTDEIVIRLFYSEFEEYILDDSKLEGESLYINVFKFPKFDPIEQDCDFLSLIRINQLVFYNCDFYYFNIKGFHEEGFLLIFKYCNFKSDFLVESFIGAKIFLEKCTAYENFNVDALEKSFLSFEKSKLREKVEVWDLVDCEVSIRESRFEKEFIFISNSIINFFCRETRFISDINLSHCDFIGYRVFFDKVSFNGYVNFDFSNFREGIEIDPIRLKETEYINFIGAKIGFEGTRREIFRMIKHSFDKVGNHIEANKYHALEMKKHKEEMKQEPWSQKKLVFWLNDVTSNFGQSYLKPIGWLLLITTLYSIIFYGYEQNWLYQESFSLPAWLEYPINGLNYAASKIIPFQGFLKDNKGIEFISLVFYVIFASLIWQVVVALKRHTRR